MCFHRLDAGGAHGLLLRRAGSDPVLDDHVLPIDGCSLGRLCSPVHTTEESSLDRDAQASHWVLRATVAVCSITHFWSEFSSGLVQFAVQMQGVCSDFGEVSRSCTGQQTEGSLQEVLERGAWSCGVASTCSEDVRGVEEGFFGFVQLTAA